MLKVLVFIALLALIACAAVIYWMKVSAQPKQAFPNYFLERKGLFDQLPGAPQVVFLGDSLTDNNEWQEFFPGIVVANRGISGDTVSGVLFRAEQVTELNPRAVFLMIGINDLYRGATVEQVLSGYRQLVSYFTNNNIRLFIQSNLLTARPDINTKVNRLNEQLQVLASDYDQVDYVELNQALAEAGLLNSNFTRDGLHLNGEGYRAWVSVIQPLVQSLDQ